MSTYSILFTVRRTTTERAHVNVLLTEDMLLEPEEDGTRRLDVAKVAARAVELGQSADVEWQVDLHPTQRAKDSA